jgi:AraC-like DNA-binding protein
MAITLIALLNDGFNFFSFEKDLVVSPYYDDKVLRERMGRIIPYIYEHHAEKLALTELAEMEHLSTFHLSHMIKACTGLGFREFLCFARVEFSERLLLSENARVSSVADKVGFSTTAYYEKYFLRWFGRTPEEHKEKYLPLIKTALYGEAVVNTDIAKAIDIVRRQLNEFAPLGDVAEIDPKNNRALIEEITGKLKRLSCDDLATLLSVLESLDSK